MAPQGLSRLLGLEITPTATRPPASPCGGQDTDPAHDAGEPIVGRTARPRRTSQAWDRDQSGCCLQVHGSAPEAAIADLADIPSEPCGLSGVNRYPSRSRIRYLGAVSHGKASRICCETHCDVGCAVTPKCTMRRRSWCRTMNTNRSRNVAVGTTKKSIDARQPTWFRRNVRQVCNGGFGCRIMYLETVA